MLSDICALGESAGEREMGKRAGSEEVRKANGILRDGRKEMGDRTFCGTGRTRTPWGKSESWRRDVECPWGCR